MRRPRRRNRPAEGNPEATRERTRRRRRPTLAAGCSSGCPQRRGSLQLLSSDVGPVGFNASASECSPHGRIVHKTLVSVSRQSETKVSSIPSSNRSVVAGLVSCAGDVTDVAGALDYGRRSFLRRLAMTLGAAHAGVFAPGTVQADERAPRELAATVNAAEWINSRRLPPSSLAGKVVLIDFWTYTCINWLRTLPYVRAWAQRYPERFVVIGVHTPEFPFERNVDNVRRAVQQM